MAITHNRFYVNHAMMAFFNAAKRIDGGNY